MSGACPSRHYRIATRTDVVIVALQARELASALGFPRRRAVELGIVTSELASNLVRHGGGGGIALSEVTLRNRRSTLSVIAYDHGPPVADLGQALGDGCDDRGPLDPATLVFRGGLGTGLGAVKRLADFLEYHQGSRGKVFVARFLAPCEKALAPCTGRPLVVPGSPS